MSLDATGIAHRIAAGDTLAEEELTAFFRPRVVFYVQSRTQDYGLAEDIAQEVLLAVLHALRNAQVRELDHLPGYVFGTARNQLSAALRSKSRRRTEAIDESSAELAGAPVDFEDRQRRTRLRAAIEALEEKERSVLQLVLVEGYSPAEISASLGVTQDVVRQRKSRALKKLTAWLNPPSQMGPPGTRTGKDGFA